MRHPSSSDLKRIVCNRRTTKSHELKDSSISIDHRFVMINNFVVFLLTARQCEQVPITLTRSVGSGPGHQVGKHPTKYI